MTVKIYNIAVKHRPYISHMIKEMRYYDESLLSFHYSVYNDDGVYSLELQSPDIGIVANEKNLRIIGIKLTGFELPRTDFFEVSII